MHPCLISHKDEQLLLKLHFQSQKHFEPNVLKWVIKTIFISSNPFALLIINIQKEWCTFSIKKGR
jgi:hypothetical protein